MLKKQKILITGATGNVGKHLVTNLLVNKYNISCLTTRDKKAIYDVKGDLNDYNSLFEATKNIDIVIHLAAALNGSKKKLNKINAQGTRNLIKACGKNNVKKILFISSLDIKFRTNYGVSKLKAEKIIKDSSLYYIILRPSAIYGIGFKTGINSLVKILKKTRIIPIMGAGETLYQPLYVGDLVLLIKQIIDSDKFNNKCYFVGGSKIINFNKLIDLIGFNFRKKIIKIHLPIKSKNFRFNKTCSNKEIKKDFEFNPISIEEGIKKIL